MKLPLIILGLGNNILGDDAAGILVAEKLGKKLKDFSLIKVESTSLGGLRIIDFLKNYNSAILIDSIRTGLKPAGYIHKFSNKDFVNSIKMVSYHNLNFSTAIEFAKKIGIPMPEEIFIYAIESKSISEFTYKISVEVKYAINKCADEIYSFVFNELKKENLQLTRV
ncbi:hydrogenase maturation protease [Rosettibacter firmus]|uniref:hydrogenase maturation protease n=1 Tax=Rosettibacter firmus TaxID=3111522 RepID=UPI00336C2864